jgi:hypothetical protein
MPYHVKRTDFDSLVEKAVEGLRISASLYF